MRTAITVCYTITMMIACGNNGSSAPDAASQPDAAKEGPSLRWEGTEEGLDIGVLTTWLDYSDTEAGTIDVGFFRKRASGTSQGAVLLIQGGPGGDVGELILLVEGGLIEETEPLPELLKRFDAILINQRGVGQNATPVACSEANANWIIGDGVDATKLAACMEEIGADLPLKHISTANIARDADTLRDLLGYTSWTVYGVSYGSYVALEYARRFEANLETLIIDGVAPPTVPMFTEQDTFLQRSLERLEEACASEERCAAQTDDLLGDVIGLLDRAEAGEWTVNVNGSSVTITTSHIHEFLHGMLQGSEERYQLPFAVAKLRDGDDTPLTENMGGGVGANIAQHVIIMCNERFAANELTDEELAERSDDTLFGMAVYRSYHEACPIVINKTGEVELDLTPVELDLVPVLLMSGSDDPSTAPEWADEAAATITSSQHVIVPGYGHGVIDAPCANGLAAEVVGGAVLPVDASCLSDVEIPWPDPEDYSWGSAALTLPRVQLIGRAR